MQRLTEKGYVSCNIDEDISCDYCPNADLEDCLNKLGKLEDTEEELGIDLITLFNKVMKAQKIYFKKKEYRKGKISYSKSFELIRGLDKKIRLICYCFDQCYYENRGCEFGIILELEDYGKTWGLTKEELKCTV